MKKKKEKKREDLLLGWDVKLKDLVVLHFIVI